MAGPGEVDLDVSLDTKDVIAGLQQVVRKIQESIKSAKDFQAALKAAVGEVPQNLQRARTAINQLQQGSFTSALTNAGIRGRGADLNASSLGQFTQLTNQQIKFFQDAAKAAQASLRIESLRNDQVFAGNKLEQARSLVMQRQLNLAKELAASGGAYTGPVAQAQQRLQASLALQEKIKASQKGGVDETAKIEQQKLNIQLNSARMATAEFEKNYKLRLAAEKAAAAASAKIDDDKLKRQLASAKMATAAYEKEQRIQAADLARYNKQAYQNSPEALQAQGARNRAIRNESLFGDGGASLLALQARLLLQYKALSVVGSTLAFITSSVTDIDSALHQLQAITLSTNAQMLTFKDTLFGVAQQTRFSAKELIDAATTMAQAGLSLSEITTALKPISQLATATGSTLKEAVDLTTSALTQFNLRAEETGRIADVVTTALNLTKLDVNKLALGLQYAGNIAADSNVSFTELVAVLGELSQSGIRSGSTLGTGLRQLIVGLANPTQELKDKLVQLGLTTSDIDIKTQGLVGVMENLRSAGFTTADALQTLEVRAGNIYSAFSRRLDQVGGLYEALNLTSDSANAASIQLESFSAKFQRLQNVVATVSSSIGSGVLSSLGSIVDGLSKGILVVSRFSGVLSVLGTSLTTGAISAGLGGIAVLLGGFIARMVTAASVLAEGATAVGLFAGALRLLTAAFTPFRLATLAIFVGITAINGVFSLFTTKTEDLQTKIDSLHDRIESLKASFDTSQTSIQAVSDQIKILTDRSVSLNDHQDELQLITYEVQKRFGDLGLTMDGSVTKVEQLIGALQNLRKELQQGTALNLQLASISYKQQADTLAQQVKEQLSLQSGKNPLAGITNRAADLFGGNHGRDEGLVLGLNSDPLSAEQRAITNITSQYKGLDQDTASQFYRSVREAMELANPARTSAPDLAEVQGLLKQFVDLNRDMNQRFNFDVPKQIKDEIQGSIEVLTGVANKLTTIKGLNQQAVNTDSQAKVQGFLEGKGQELQTELDKLNLLKQNLVQNEVDPLRNAGEKIKKAREVGAQLGDAFKSFQDIVNQLTPEQLDSYAKSGLKDDFNSLKVQATGLGDKVEKEFHDSLVKTLQSEIDVVNKEISYYESRAKAPVHQGEADKAIETAKAKINERSDLETQLLKLQTKTFAPDLRDRQTLAEQRSIEQERTEAITRLNDYKQRRGELETLVNDIPKRFDKDLQNTTKIFDQQSKVQNDLITAMEQQQTALSLPLNKDNISDVQRTDYGKTIEVAKTQVFKNLAEIEQKRGNILDTLVKSIQDQLDYFNQKLVEVNAELSKYDTSNQRYKELTGERNQIGQTIERLKAALDQTVTARTGSQDKQNKATAEYNARTAPAQALDLYTGLHKAFEQWQEDSGVMKDSIAQLIDTSKELWSTMSDGLKASVNDWVTGTKTMKEAFAAFAQSVIAKMLDIAETQAINGLFKLLGEAALTAFAPGGGAAVTPGVGAGATFGDSIAPHAGGGLVVGGIPGRDSVHALLQPDEYVLKTSAVKAIGRDKLDQLNQSGSLQAKTASLQPPGSTKNPASGSVNVWVVSPEQVPPPGPRDIIATVGRDIHTGGSLKKLIKQVQLGQV